MKRTTNWLYRAAALALVLVLALPLAGRADDHKNNQKKQDDEKQAEKEKTRQLKIFELEHREPEEIEQLLTFRSQAPALHGFPRGAALQQRVAGYRGVAPDGLAIAVDAEQRLLFVRGSEDQIEDVEKLVKAFDVPKDQLKSHQFGDMHLIPVREADRVRSMLSQLRLGHQTLQIGDVDLVVLRVGESDAEKKEAEQAKEVIAKMNGVKKPAKVEEDAAEDAPAEDALGEDAPAEDAPGDEAAAEDTPADAAEDNRQQ